MMWWRSGSLLVFCAAMGCAATADRTGDGGGADVSSVETSTDGAVADVARGRREICNGIDDDLDGRTDEGCPIRLTRDARHDAYADVSGTRVVWVRFGLIAVGDVGDLMVRDLPGGEERRLATNARYPSISGDRVAFLRERQIVWIDVRDGIEHTIAVDEASYVQAPEISGRRIVWSQIQRDSEEDYEVVVYETDTGRRFRVGSHATIQEFPRVDGDTLVWSDDRHGHHTVGLLHLFDVYRADLSVASVPPAIVQVTRRDGEIAYDFIAAVDGGRALVTESRGPLLGTTMRRPCTPVLFDLASGRRTAIAPESSECYRAQALSGRRAAVEFDADGVSDLFVIDVESGVRRRVTDYARRSTRARLDGNWLVWQDDRNDHWDLYAMDLTDVDRGDFSPEGVTP